MRKNPIVVLRELGFKDLAEWRKHIEDHAAEIVADRKRLGVNKTLTKWRIGTNTLRKLVYEAEARAEPAQPITAKDFAEAILEGYATLKTENYQLKQHIEGLKLVIHGYELEEQRRKMENEQLFQAKVNSALAEPGENQL